MFKTLHEDINIIRDKIDDFCKTIHNHYEAYNHNAQSINIKLQHMPSIKSLEGTIQSQQRTIEQLTNALKDKYEHGLFIVSEDGKQPMVIRNGVELTNQYVREFTISWCHGEIPYINIEQLAGTYQDTEV